MSSSLILNNTVRLCGSGNPFSMEVQLNIPCGSVYGLSGSSGTGKTTLLRLISGLQKPDSGVSSCEGVCWYSTKPPVFVPAWKRRVSLVFQNYALFPHLNVLQNIRYGAAHPEDAEWALSLCALDSLRRRRSHELSGGQRQRVAIARALACRPRVLLLDEPFSALDAVSRARLSDNLASVFAELNCTIILVSHLESDLQRLCHSVLDIRDISQNSEEASSTDKIGRFIPGYVVEGKRADIVSVSQQLHPAAPLVQTPALQRLEQGRGDTLAAIRLKDIEVFKPGGIPALGGRDYQLNAEHPNTGTGDRVLGHQDKGTLSIPQQHAKSSHLLAGIGREILFKRKEAANAIGKERNITFSCRTNLEQKVLTHIVPLSPSIQEVRL
jgi:molybdate transport system ATP-binding protein